MHTRLTPPRESEAGWLKEYRARRRAWSQAARQRCQERGELYAALDSLMERWHMEEADWDAARAIRRRIAELDAEAARAVTL